MDAHIRRKNILSFYNTVIRHAWTDFVQRKREELLNTGVNTTTSCWAKTGYFPFNQNPEAWRNVLITIGKLNKEMKKSENGDTVEEKELEIT